MEYQCLTIKPSQIVDLMYNSGILPTIYACRFNKENSDQFLHEILHGICNVDTY